MKEKNKSVDYSSLIKGTKKQLNKNVEAINNLTDKLIYLEGDAIDIVSKKINEMARKNTQLNQELLELEREKIFSEVDSENLKLLTDNIYKFLKRFDKIHITEKQNFAKSILESVIWDSYISDSKDKKGKITLKFLE